MSAILTILGRATRDPEMQQGKNSGTEYVSLDIAVSQRGQDGKEETKHKGAAKIESRQRKLILICMG